MASEWTNEVWAGTLKVVQRGKECAIQFIDLKNGSLFAMAIVKEGVVERTIDSSRYFVIKIEKQGRHAFIGVAFNDRNEAFDFNVALQEFQKDVEREEMIEAGIPLSEGPKLDLSLKDGEKIKVKVNVGKSSSRSKKTGGAGGGFSGGLLAPPPSDTTSNRTAAKRTPGGKPSSSVGSNSLLGFDDEPSFAQPANNSSSTGFSDSSFLFDSPAPSPAPAPATDSLLFGFDSPQPPKSEPTAFGGGGDLLSDLMGGSSLAAPVAPQPLAFNVLSPQPQLQPPPNLMMGGGLGNLNDLMSTLPAPAMGMQPGIPQHNAMFPPQPQPLQMQMGIPNWQQQPPQPSGNPAASNNDPFAGLF